jgi:cobalamin synthase
MAVAAGLQYLRSFPEPFYRTGEDTPARWAEYALPVWGTFVGVGVATLDQAFGYMFGEPLISSALTVAVLAAASRRRYPGHFARSSASLGLSAGHGDEKFHISYTGVAALVALFLVKVMALNALWLTLRWPVIALIPLASRWAMVVSMNVLPCAQIKAPASPLVHRRSFVPIVFATLLFAVVPLGHVYLSSKGFGLFDLSINLATRIWVAAASVAALSSIRTAFRLRGWTVPRLGSLCEMVEVCVPLAVVLTIPG